MGDENPSSNSRDNPFFRCCNVWQNRQLFCNMTPRGIFCIMIFTTGLVFMLVSQKNMQKDAKFSFMGIGIITMLSAFVIYSIDCDQSAVVRRRGPFWNSNVARSNVSQMARPVPSHLIPFHHTSPDDRPPPSYSEAAKYPKKVHTENENELPSYMEVLASQSDTESVQQYSLSQSRRNLENTNVSNENSPEH